jgi:hypothetical protein
MKLLNKVQEFLHDENNRIKLADGLRWVADRIHKPKSAS